MRIGSLFSGIGGFELGLEWAGLGETVWQVEIDDYCNKVLELRWPDAKRYRDIREVHGIITDRKGNRLETGRMAQQGQAGQFTGHSESLQAPICPNCLPTVDLICGGFPCQPFSVAGKRRGKEDDRFLWHEMLRVIAEINPTFVIGENVPGIINMALDQVLTDLENIGYETATFIIPACAVNAPHRRDRVFVIAYSGHWYGERQPQRGKYAEPNKQGNAFESERPIEGDGIGFVTNSDNQRLQGQPNHVRGKGQKPNNEQFTRCSRGWQENWIEVATNLLRVDDGLSAWIYRYIGGIENATTLKKLSRQDLRDLWKILQSEKIQRKMGECWKIPDKTYMLSVLCELSERAYRQDNLSSESEEIQGQYMRDLWNFCKSRYASQGWEYTEQHQKEHTDIMPSMPYEVALEIKKSWHYLQYAQKAISSNRVSRLKCLGNAVVPTVSYSIGRIIKQWLQANSQEQD